MGRAGRGDEEQDSWSSEDFPHGIPLVDEGDEFHEFDGDWDAFDEEFPVRRSHSTAVRLLCAVLVVAVVFGTIGAGVDEVIRGGPARFSGKALPVSQVQDALLGSDGRPLPNLAPGVLANRLRFVQIIFSVSNASSKAVSANCAAELVRKGSTETPGSSIGLAHEQIQPHGIDRLTATVRPFRGWTEATPEFPLVACNS